MSSTLGSEQLFTLKNRQIPQQFTIIAEDPFLTYFAEKFTKTCRQMPHLKHHYLEKDKGAIKTSLISQDLFQESQGHIISIKGTDLKHEALQQLIEEHTHIPIIYIVEKLLPAQKRSKSFVSLTKHSTLISTKALSEKKTQLWAKGLYQHYQINIPDRLVQAICQRLDWDLSSLEQLAIQMHHQNIKQMKTLDELTPFMLTTHQAPIFTQIDQLFSGKYQESHLFFQTHHQSDVLQKIYWMSIKRLRTMLKLQEKMILSKQNVTTFLQNERIWPQLRIQYQRVLQLPKHILHKHYLALCELEYILKGQIRLDFNSSAITRLLSMCRAFGSSTK
jgi:hypothetical protein